MVSMGRIIESVDGDLDWVWQSPGSSPRPSSGGALRLGVALLSGRCWVMRCGRRESIEVCHLAVLPVEEALRLEFRSAVAVLFSIPELSRIEVRDGASVLLGPVSAGVLDSVFFERSCSHEHQLTALRLVCFQLAELPAAGLTPADPGDDDAGLPLWQAADRYMREHLDEPLNLSQILAALACGKARLSGELREHFSRTPMQHLAVLRVRHARDCLEQNSMPIGEIAYAVGYADVAAFSHFFKRHTGLSPSQARENARWLA